MWHFRWEIALPFHHNHFHIYLRPPTVVHIGGNTPPLQLQAAGVETTKTEIASNSDNPLINEDMTMFVSLLVPYLPPDQEVASIASPPAYVQVAATDPKIDYSLVDSCSLVDSPDASVLFPNKTKGGLPAVLYPADALQKVVLSKGLPELDLTTANVLILDEPQHGQLRALKILESARNRGLGYQYLPNPGYRGADFVKALVEYKGQRIKVIMKFVVVDAVIDNTEGAPGGYRNGNSGGGATVDKLANDCDANYNVRRIGGAAAEGQVFTQWADVVQDLARYTGRLAVSKVKSTPWLKQGSCGRCECSQ